VSLREISPLFPRLAGQNRSPGSLHRPTADRAFFSGHGSFNASHLGVAPLTMNLSRHGPLSPNNSRHGPDQPSWRDEWSNVLSESSIAIQPFSEPYVGVWMAHDEELSKLTAEELMLRQGALQKLYEGRIASLERFVGFVILFHEMAKRVQARGPQRSPAELSPSDPHSSAASADVPDGAPPSGSQPPPLCTSGLVVLLVVWPVHLRHVALPLHHAHCFHRLAHLGLRSAD
jgi:hypothetical protein